MSVRPLRPFAVRIHKPDARHCGEPVIVLSIRRNRYGEFYNYYTVRSLSSGAIMAVHVSCLLRNRESVNIARRVSRAYQKKVRLGG